MDNAPPFEGADTVASGLRVPSAIGDFLILQSIRDSNGYALAVSDDALLEGVTPLGKAEGIFAAPEAGATVAALENLLENGQIQKDEQIVLFITGSGIKYMDVFNSFS